MTSVTGITISGQQPASTYRSLIFKVGSGSWSKLTIASGVATLTRLAGSASATADAASTATQNGGGQGGFPSGYCFIYCNEIKNEDTTGAII